MVEKEQVAGGEPGEDQNEAGKAASGVVRSQDAEDRHAADDGRSCPDSREPQAGNAAGPGRQRTIVNLHAG